MTPPAPSPDGPPPALAKAKDHPAQVKETLISLIIAFVMAFVFRAFVAEAFIIPTGSMAPTLLGEHQRQQGPRTGYNWPVDPSPGASSVEDPMSGDRVAVGDRRRAGDRILVFKYLYQVYEPRRWDVVVFKAPHDPQTNYIKRLAGLPGEQLALLDGDVFVRRPDPAETHTPQDNAWARPGWRIQRKDERSQRAVWQDVFWSHYRPIPTGGANAAAFFRSPWTGGPAWRIDGLTSYRYTGAGRTTLSWSNDIRPIDDRYPYNELRAAATGAVTEFAVSDISMSAGVEPTGAGPVAVSAVVRARGHEFRADIVGRAVTLRMGELGSRDPGAGQAPTRWTTLATGELDRPVEPGRVTDLEFWHADQSLQLRADGELVCSGVYDWTPEQRLRFALGLTLEEVYQQALRRGWTPLGDASRYQQPRVWWEFDGGPLTLHRVGLQRDIHYQYPPQQAGRGIMPTNPVLLGPDHFFVLGDNSPSSLDARLWGPPDPWVAAQIDPADGVVPRDLLIGRAFFVYFPALTRGGLGIPVPDFGRLRWIW